MSVPAQLLQHMEALNCNLQISLAMEDHQHGLTSAASPRCKGKVDTLESIAVPILIVAEGHYPKGGR